MAGRNKVKQRPEIENKKKENQFRQSTIAFRPCHVSSKKAIIKVSLMRQHFHWKTHAHAVSSLPYHLFNRILVKHSTVSIKFLLWSRHWQLGKKTEHGKIADRKWRRTGLFHRRYRSEEKRTQNEQYLWHFYMKWDVKWSQTK